MPVRELTPYVAMQPRVEAQRAMNAAEQIAVGTGRLKPDDHRAAVERWRTAMRAASGVRRPGAEEIGSKVLGSRIGFRTVSVRKPAIAAESEASA
jgi:formylmethanofuran dehydrogenase subunit A